MYSSSQSCTTPLRELTCHMGSHSVTCHPAEVTFPPLPQPKLVLDLATPEGCKAELTCNVARRAVRLRYQSFLLLRPVAHETGCCDYERTLVKRREVEFTLNCGGVGVEFNAPLDSSTALDRNVMSLYEPRLTHRRKTLEEKIERKTF